MPYGIHIATSKVYKWVPTKCLSGQQIPRGMRVMSQYHKVGQKPIASYVSKVEPVASFLQWAFENPDQVIVLGFGIILFGMALK